MTDEAKALVEELRKRRVYKDGVRRQPRKHEREAADLIETQAREIDRLREALGDLLLYAAPNTLGSLPVFNRARAALAGDSHAQ